jgi:MFS family permease
MSLRQSVMRAFQHRDFRLLWWGAMVSFVGSWIQNSGERWLVNELTHDIAKLSIVAFCGSAPVAVLGPFAGTFADSYDKKALLNIAQILFAVGALFLGIVSMLGVVQYWEMVAVALLFGIVGAFEGPTRQSVVSRVVPAEDLAHAVPLNAMTFNVARLIGPMVAGLLLATFAPIFGPMFAAGLCYVLNGISYIALIFAVLAIKANLKPFKKQTMPVGDLIMEGMLYTFRDPRFKTLFIMEVIASACGMFYIAVMPAFVTDILHLGALGYSLALTTVGIGAVFGLLLLTTLADMPVKSQMVRYGMLAMGVAIFLLGYVRTSWLAFPLLLVIGCGVMVQFNTTNTLFQLLSPDRLRGRVLAMHQWAIGGLGPFGTLFFGWFAENTKVRHLIHFQGYSFNTPVGGLPLALKIGGACILLGALWGSWKIRSLVNHSWELNQSLSTETAS